MDNKNVLVAVVLSTLVIMFWQFMYGEEYTEQENLQTKTEQVDTDKPSAPSLSKNIEIKNVSRDDALKSNERIQFENNKIKGSIALKGALIDDVTLKNYNLNQNSNDEKAVSYTHLTLPTILLV